MTFERHSPLWTAERARSAEAVPAWIKPQPKAGGFRTLEVRAAGFSPWGDGEEDAASPAAAEPTLDLEQIRAQAFAEGFEQGRHTMEADVVAERQAVARLAESLQSLRPEPPQALALLLNETVMRLVTDIVGAVPIDTEALLARAEAAAAFVAEDCGLGRLRLHPDDAQRLAQAQLDVDIVVDPAVAPGNIVMETAAGWIEDGPEVRLERLRQSLDRMGAAR